MAKDATREEAIQWAIDNKCDFKTPVFPPPTGWLWAGSTLVLTPVFTNTVEADITVNDLPSTP